MTRIYFVRHGESTGNLNYTFNGVTDTELTDKGMRQGRYLGARFRDIPLDAVYSSPLKRAWATSQLLCEDRDIEPVVDPLLIEVSGGKFEALPMSVIEGDEQAIDLWYNRPWDWIGPGADDGGVRAAYQRVRSVLERVVREHAGQTVVLSAHGYMLRLFNCHVKGLTLEQLGEIGFGANTCVSCADFLEDGSITIQFINDTSHLPDEEMTKDMWKEEILD